MIATVAPAPASASTIPRPMPPPPPVTSAQRPERSKSADGLIVRGGTRRRRRRGRRSSASAESCPSSMQARASGQASSTSSTGITPSPSGTDTGPDAGSSHEAPAVLEVEDLDRPARDVVPPPRRRPRRGARWPCRSRRAGRPDLLDEPLELVRREVAMVLEREQEPVVAGGGARLAQQAGESTGGPAAMCRSARHDPHDREPELRRGLEPVQEALERLGALAERETLGRAPRQADRDAVRLGDERGGGESGRVAEEARLQEDEVEPEPSSLRHDVERAAREDVQRRQSRRAGPRRAGGGTRSCRRRREPASAPPRRRARDVVVLASVPAMVLGFGDPVVRSWNRY